MSEIHNQEGLNSTTSQHYGEKQDQEPKDVAFKGEKTDLKYDPAAVIKRTWVKTPVKTNLNGKEITFGSKEVDQAQKDLAVLNQNPVAVKKAMSLYPAFYGYAQSKGEQNPEKLALALQHYAATNEFIRKIELEENK